MESKAELRTCIFICLLINSELDAGPHCLGFAEIKYFVAKYTTVFVSFYSVFQFSYIRVKPEKAFFRRRWEDFLLKNILII